LAEFADSSRVASHQIAEIIGGARRNRPADDRNAGRYGKISPPAWESRFQHTDEQCRLELSHELGILT
jgi:hypothetical protein